jgi:hypothetical protein
MSAPVVYGGLGVAGRVGVGGPQPPLVRGLPPMATTAQPFIAHLYSRDLVFKRLLGPASALLNRPGLKATQNGGFQPITLELAAAAVSSNLVVDPSFEDATLTITQGSWGLNTIVRWGLDSANVRQGTSLRNTSTLVAAGAWDSAISFARFPVVPGAQYTASVWEAQNAGVKQSHAKLLWYKADGVTLSTVRTTDFLIGGTDGLKPWTQYGATIVTPSDAYYGEWNLMAGWWDGASGTNAQTWFDDVRITPGPGTNPSEGVGLCDVIRLSEQGDSAGTILVSGNVELMPEEVGVGVVHHQIVVTPWAAELGDTDFNKTYAVATEIAQFVRDAVAGSAHLSVSPASCPDTGLKYIYDFQNTNALDAVHVAKQIAGANYFYGVDAQGLVWFQPVYLANPPTLTLRRGVDYNRKKSSSSVIGMKNTIPVIGGSNPGDPGRLHSLYSNATSRRLYGPRTFNPTPSYPTVTDQPTLDAIRDSLGAQFDRVINSVEADLPALGLRLTPYRQGGLTVRFWEPAVEAIGSAPGGSGRYGPTLVVWDVTTDGPSQKLICGDIPFADTDTAYEATRIAQRVGVVSATAVPIPPLVAPSPITAPPPPPPQAQINVIYPATAAPGIYAMGGGIVNVAQVTFTTPRAGVCQIQSAIDARMESWDDYTSVRYIWADLPGIVTNAQQKLPFGIQRVNFASNSAGGIAIPAGTYTAYLKIQTAGSNQMHVYSGWLQVLWTG